MLSGDGLGSVVTGTVTDEIGHAYLVGTFSGTVDFDPGEGVAELTSLGRKDAFLLKLDAEGNYLWARAIGSTRSDAARGVVINPFGDEVIVVGEFSGTLVLDPTEPAGSLPSEGRRDVFVAAFNPDGSFNRAQRFDGDLLGGINAVAMDIDGTVIIGGEFSGTVDFDILNGGTPLTAAGDGRESDGFVAAYDLEGGLLWARQFGGEGDDAVYGVAVDYRGMVVAVGEQEVFPVVDPAVGLSGEGRSDHEDGFVTAMTREGEPLWSLAIGGDGDDSVRAVACDGEGNVIVGGVFESQVDFGPPGTGLAVFQSRGEEDGFLVQYTSQGELNWVKAFGSPEDDGIYAVSVDPIGNLIAGGEQAIAIAMPVQAGGRGSDRPRWQEAALAVKLDATGETLWSESFVATGDDHNRDDDDDRDDDDRDDDEDDSLTDPVDDGVESPPATDVPVADVPPPAPFGLADGSQVWRALGSFAAPATTTVGGLPDAVAGSFIPTGPAVPNDAVIDVAAGQTVTDAAVHTGDAVIVKTGAGTLVLDAANTHSGGLRVESGTVIIRHAAALNGGPLAVAPGARVVVDTGTDRVDVASLAIDPSGSVELGRAGFVVAADGFDAAAVRQAVIAGRNGGGWNGTAGITSAAAASESGRGVGYVVGNNGRLTVGFAAYGDTDLDGQVSAFDLIGLQSQGRFNTGAVTSWQQGDFNYDGVANVLDLVATTGSGAYGRGRYNVLPGQPPAAASSAAASLTGSSMAQVAFAAATAGPQQAGSSDGSKDGGPVTGGSSVTP